MTEEDAKKRWCPHVRIANDSFKSTTATNRGKDGSISESSTCVASDCMMWREKINISTKETSGHCGLAKLAKQHSYSRLIMYATMALPKSDVSFHPAPNFFRLNHLG